MALGNRGGRRTISNLVVVLPICLLAARLTAEMVLAPLPLIGALALIAATIALAILLSFHLSPSIFHLPPSTFYFLPLLIYVLWPTRDIRLATAIVLLVILTRLLTCKPSLPIRGGWLVFGISLAVYLFTLQKDVLPADSGEFQLVASQLGVAHPPGYPLYTMVGKIFTLLTPWRPALGLNLMSAVLAAATLALTFKTVQRIAGGPLASWGGLAATIALGTCTTFWAQATTANIRMPTMFLMAWCLYEIARFKANSSSALGRFALALSLGLTHHASLIFVGLFFIVYLVLVEPSLLWTPRRWIRPLVMFALGQLVWLYLPIRGAMGALFAPSDLTSVQGFLHHALARGFSGDMFAFAAPQYLFARLAVLPTLFLFQFNFVLLIASVCGALLTCWRDWRLGLSLIGGWALHVYVTITYRAPQTVEYMMPAYLLQVIALGSGIAYLAEWAAGRPHLIATCTRFAISGMLLADILNGVAHAPGYIQLAADHSTRDYVEPILHQAPTGALILADWHWATPLQYLQIVEGMRPDVTIEYVYPVSDVEYPMRWLQRIDEEIERRPVIVTHMFGVQFAASRYIFQPLGRAFRVSDQPVYQMPAGLTPVQLNFENRIGIIGYHLDRAELCAGHSFELELAWQPLAMLDQEYSFTVRISKDQALIAQRDRRLIGKYTPGEVRVEQFTLPLPPDLLPGQYEIAVGVYYSPAEGGWRNLDANGQTLAPLAIISVTPMAAPLLSLHPLDVPFANGARLTGVDYDRSAPNTLRVYLHWYQHSPASAGDVYLQAGNITIHQPLPAMPTGAFFTTIHDLDAAAASDAIKLELRNPSGAPIECAGAWGVAQTRVPLPPAAGHSRYVLLGNQMILTSVSSGPATLRPGQELHLALDFVARQSLVSDNSMSVRLAHTGGAWWLPQDTKPALDTIRTLKWISGSRVADPHRFGMPPDAAPGWAEAHLTVYDEFRQTILPPLDTRMGESVLLGVWKIEP